MGASFSAHYQVAISGRKRAIDVTYESVRCGAAFAAHIFKRHSSGVTHAGLTWLKVDAKTYFKTAGGAFPSLHPSPAINIRKETSMDKTESSVRRMLTAIEAPLYDVGVLSELECFRDSTALLPRPSSTGFLCSSTAMPTARTSTFVHRLSIGTPRSTILARPRLRGSRRTASIHVLWSRRAPATFKHGSSTREYFSKLLGPFAAQTLAERYDADPSAADWRRFGRLPGFTNCKPKHRKSDGRFPFVRLHSHSGEQYPMAKTFDQEITTLYEAREQEREARRLQSFLSPHRRPSLSNLSVERFRTSTKYKDRAAAADIAFCVAAYANGMTEHQIERALEDDYLSRDPSPSRRAAYIQRTMEKARRWVER